MIQEQKVIARIKKKLILDAKVYVHYEYSLSESSMYKGDYFLCHNDPMMNGSESPDKLGYKYSWMFHEYRNNRPDVGKYSDYVKIYEGSDIKNISLNQDLNTFIAMEDVYLMYLFLLKTGRFEKYDSLSFNKEGLVIVSSQEINKTIEMKIGRFIRALVDDNKDLKDFDFFDYKDVDNNWLEDISNRFKKFVNNEHVNLEIAKGEDILKGYTRDNYCTSNRSTLSSSCMSDKLNFLEIYTKNQNVELGIFYFKEKVIARCLIWNLGHKKVHDRIYYNADWAFIALDNALKDMGIEMLDSETQYIIDLETVPQNFPYIDHMRYLDPVKKQLTNIRNKNRFDMCLGLQSGNYEPMSHNVIEK